VHLHWQGWQPSLHKVHSDFEAYFEGKKSALYTPENMVHIKEKKEFLKI
jgi:hypothetical protein